MKKASKSVGPGVAAVEWVPLDARRLVTITNENLFWGKGTYKAIGNVKDAIVRVLPPAIATDEQLVELEKWLNDQGVAKVRFDSRAQADVLAEDEEVTVSTHTNQREVVLAMGEKSKQKKELLELLDFYMAKVGL